MSKQSKSSKKPNAIVSFFWKNKGQRARNIYFLLTAVFVVFAVGIGFVSSKLDLIEVDKNNDKNVQVNVNADKIYEDDKIKMIEEIQSASSFNDYIYKWANNEATLRSNKNVINVLLIGLDSADALEKGGRSDTLILASLNKKTKKIFLTSFFRDTWTNMNIGGKDSYNKINASYANGGADALIDTLERNFKIDIDYYVAVDFSSFRDIIDALGGLTVEVQEYEAKYINRTTKHTIDYGPEVKLTGEQALVFARIRHSDADSDVSRTRRQRQVISALIKSAKGASLSQLNKALDSLFKYVKTDLTKTQILSYGAQGLASGWVNYEIENIVLSDPSIFVTGYVGNSAVVFVDFPASAQIVQEAIYGDSNIVVSENSLKLFNLLKQRSDGQYIFR